MPRANIIRAVVFVMIILGFVLGVIQLFLLRFEAGDVYPAYSTLRSDPLGSRAFYRGLENLRNTSVQRNYRQLDTLEFKEPVTFFQIGTPVFDSESVAAKWVESIDRLTARGGRLVLSFLAVEKKPAAWRMSSCRLPPADDSDDPDTQSPKGSDDAETSADKGTEPSENPAGPPVSENDSQCVALAELWGLELTFAEKPATEAVKKSHEPLAADVKGLPQTISWHTALYFDELDISWRVVYTAADRPVIVERPYGNGSLVLSADSYYLSNEALRSERLPQLLAWTVGQNSQIIFDETHLGIRRQPGVLSLIKKYRFQWFIFAVAVLAILFVWKNSAYFVPPPRNGYDRLHRHVYAGRDSTQGLISLLRRNIPKRQILQICAREWWRAFRRNQRFAGSSADANKTAFEKIKAYGAQSKDPVIGYRQMCKIISKGRHNE
ncbi:MAG: DUF4350 domain-containing protein [Desulfobacterales bacterium]